MVFFLFLLFVNCPLDVFTSHFCAKCLKAFWKNYIQFYCAEYEVVDSKMNRVI